MSQIRSIVLILSSVIMASGLVALVDDCINRRCHQKSRMQMMVPKFPKAPFRLNTESVGPKRLLDDILNRREKSTSRRPCRLRTTTC